MDGKQNGDRGITCVSMDPWDILRAEFIVGGNDGPGVRHQHTHPAFSGSGSRRRGVASAASDRAEVGDRHIAKALVIDRSVVQ